MTSWDWTPETRGALGRFLVDRGVLGSADVTTRAIGDGHSNLTYLVTGTAPEAAAGHGGLRQVVVRRPPPPPTPPGAHDMLREARLLRGLAATAVPVPQVLATAQAGEVIDVACYVMSHVDGPVVTTETHAALTDPQTRREVGESLVDVLADLHAVDWRAAGLADLGRPEGFNARHLRRMAGLVADGSGALPAPFAAVAEWLADHVPPESGASIVHNDFRLGNVVLAPTRPGRVAAVLDWELATLGDPLFDLGYLVASIPRPDAPLTPTAAFATAMLEPGYPAADELVARYAARTGRAVDGLAWYVALAYWKLAALYEYGRRRAVEGVGDAYYADPAQVDSFLAAARRTADAA